MASYIENHCALRDTLIKILQITKPTCSSYFFILIFCSLVSSVFTYYYKDHTLVAIVLCDVLRISQNRAHWERVC